MPKLLPLFLLLAATTSARAGDPAKGEMEFRKCVACHAVIANDGTVLRKGGKTGPNLFGVIGRQIGAYPDFGYGESIVAAGADGSVWTQETLAIYLSDPTAWLKEKTGDDGARSKMSFKLAKGAEDVAAYLAMIAAEE